MKSYYVYILASINKVLYVGVTSNLEKRISEHKNGIYGGFTSKYHIDKLVFFEEFHDINEAISAEKKIEKLAKKMENGAHGKVKS